LDKAYSAPIALWTAPVTRAPLRSSPLIGFSGARHVTCFRISRHLLGRSCAGSPPGLAAFATAAWRRRAAGLPAYRLTAQPLRMANGEQPDFTLVSKANTMANDPRNGGRR